MRRRFAMVGVLALLGAALVLPPTAAASMPTSVQPATSAEYFVLRNTCSNSGGLLGYGKSVLRVEQEEYGRSGVAQFRQRAVAQMRWGGRWHTVDRFAWQYSSWFGNTNTSHYFIFKFTEHWGSDHHYYYGRLKWRGEWLSSSGNVLYYQNVKGRAC